VEKAFTSYELAGKTLKNRIVMAPMTRSRAQDPGGIPTELNALYYAQRASAGLIITEGVQPSAVGQGYIHTPGLHSAEQVAGWKKVTDAVHTHGGLIFAQLLHTGRIGHPDLHPNGLLPVGPSPIAAKGQVLTSTGLHELGVPKEMTDTEIVETISDFADAAKNAMDAGFDGVELHGANGYLIHQFLSTNANLRTDKWGGTIEGHIRFGVEVAKAVASAIGAEKVGFRISPANPFNTIVEDDIEGTYVALIKELAKLDLKYLHFIENPDQNQMVTRVRTWWPKTLIVNTFSGKRGKTKADLALIESGGADLLAFGQLFLANPDLPTRLKTDGPFNTPDPKTFYGGDGHGYTDYPTLA